MFGFKNSENDVNSKLSKAVDSLSALSIEEKLRLAEVFKRHAEIQQKDDERLETISQSSSYYAKTGKWFTDNRSKTEKSPQVRRKSLSVPQKQYGNTKQSVDNFQGSNLKPEQEKIKWERLPTQFSTPITKLKSRQSTPERELRSASVSPIKSELSVASVRPRISLVQRKVIPEYSETDSTTSKKTKTVIRRVRVPKLKHVSSQTLVQLCEKSCQTSSIEVNQATKYTMTECYEQPKIKNASGFKICRSPIKVFELGVEKDGMDKEVQAAFQEFYDPAELSPQPYNEAAVSFSKQVDASVLFRVGAGPETEKKVPLSFNNNATVSCTK